MRYKLNKNDLKMMQRCCDLIHKLQEEQWKKQGALALEDDVYTNMLCAEELFYHGFGIIPNIKGGNLK